MSYGFKVGMTADEAVREMTFMGLRASKPPEIVREAALGKVMRWNFPNMTVILQRRKYNGPYVITEINQSGEIHCEHRAGSETGQPGTSAGDALESDNVSLGADETADDTGSLAGEAGGGDRWVRRGRHRSGGEGAG